MPSPSKSLSSSVPKPYWNPPCENHLIVTLARYYLRYLREYERQGILIDYLSLFNEPGIHTKIPYEKIRDLLKNHVRPLFAREGVRTKLQLSEAPDRGNAYRNYPTVLDDPEARKYVANLPHHGYRSDLVALDPLASSPPSLIVLILKLLSVVHNCLTGNPQAGEGFAKPVKLLPDLLCIRKSRSCGLHCSKRFKYLGLARLD